MTLFALFVSSSPFHTELLLAPRAVISSSTRPYSTTYLSHSLLSSSPSSSSSSVRSLSSSSSAFITRHHTTSTFLYRSDVLHQHRQRPPLQKHLRHRQQPSMYFSRNEKPDPILRLVACLPYLLPLLDSLTFGNAIFAKFPTIGRAFLTPLLPLLSIYRGIPFFAFGVFIALILLVVRNPNVPRFVRFNTNQAILLDVVLIVPQLFSGMGGAIGGGSGGGMAMLGETLSGAVFYAIVVSVAYAIASNIKGDYPDGIPLISESAANQIGPF